LKLTQSMAMTVPALQEGYISLMITKLQKIAYHVKEPVSNVYHISESMTALKLRQSPIIDETLKGQRGTLSYFSVAPDLLEFRRRNKDPVIRTSTAVDNARPVVNTHCMHLLVVLPGARSEKATNSEFVLE